MLKNDLELKHYRKFYNYVYYRDIMSITIYDIIVENNKKCYLEALISSFRINEIKGMERKLKSKI